MISSGLHINKMYWIGKEKKNNTNIEKVKKWVKLDKHFKDYQGKSGAREATQSNQRHDKMWALPSLQLC